MKPEKQDTQETIAQMQQTIAELQGELNIEKQSFQNLQSRFNNINPKWSRLVALRDAIHDRGIANAALLEELPKSSSLHEALQNQINLDTIVLEHLAIPFGDYE